MKTLDEAIKMNEQILRLANLPEDDTTSTAGISLHYLKEYRTTRESLLENLKRNEDREMMLIHALAEIEDNPPLSWDELKQMEGKPVWVEALLYKQWAVIAYVGSDHIRFEGANLYAPESRDYMGVADGWQAYRKERE